MNLKFKFQREKIICKFGIYRTGTGSTGHVGPNRGRGPKTKQRATCGDRSQRKRWGPPGQVVSRVGQPRGPDQSR